MVNQLPVLIIGAGPTGLMMACLLAHHGISFRIIDKNANRVATSNAVWIQPASLELFEKLGIARQFTNLGQHCHAINLRGKKSFSELIPLNHGHSAFPYALMLPQSETEQLLINHLLKLNITIERSTELIDIQQDSNLAFTAVIATVRHADNRLETIKSDWLIACDGARSTAREKSQVFFTGADFPEQFIVADAKMDSFMSHHEIHLFIGQKKIFAVFPLGANRYRIMANISQSHPRKLFIEKEVREIVSERTYGSYTVHEVSWIQPFWVHSKIVKQMRHGAIFFAGDAAHIHSPISGQGLNTGLQDAYNLAWKLALVIKDKAKPSLLDTYQAERFPVINKLVKQSETLTQMALSNKDFASTLKKYFSTLSAKPKLITRLANEITQATIQYKNSDIIQYNPTTVKKHIHPGMRAPDVFLSKSSHLYNYFSLTKHTVLLFSGLDAKKAKLKKITKLNDQLNQAYSELLKTEIISIKPLENSIHDKEALIHKRYRVKFAAIYIIRPDNFIAFYSKKFDLTLVDNFLQTYLFPPSFPRKREPS